MVDKTPIGVVDNRRGCQPPIEICVINKPGKGW